jgi:drug/metabolite transporter (DMT)-like permease
MSRVDWRALVGAVLAGLMLGVYLAVMHRQGDRPLVWFTAGLAIGVLLAVYGAFRAAPQRRTALYVATILLGGLGFIGLLTIGFPIVIGAVLCLLAALAADRPASRVDA